MRRRRVILAAVVLIAGAAAFAAVRAPSFLSSLNRTRQKRTMADLRSIGTALAALHQDTGGYPAAPSGPLDPILPSIVPGYLREVSLHDGWGRAFRYESDGTSFRLRSAGRDGRWESQPELGSRPGFDADLIYSDGAFVQWPEGICT